MSQDDASEAQSLGAAMNKITATIHNKWSDLSKRHLSTDARHALADDLKACLRQLNQLSDRLNASER